jgi:hypothetical protein
LRAASAEDRDGGVRPAGQVRFGLAGKGLWDKLDRLRAGPVRKGIIPVQLELHAEIKYFGRHKGGFIRDGVILSLRVLAPAGHPWSCDADEVIAAFDQYDESRATRTRWMAGTHRAGGG